MPNKLAGSYASCPRCQGRFWVSKDASFDSSLSDSVGVPSVSALAQAPNVMPPTAAPPGWAVPPPAGAGPASAAAQPQVPPRPYFPSVTPLAPMAPPAAVPIPLPPVDGAPITPPAAPPQARKVARLVSADTAQSTLKLAADGQLPYLQLQEGDKKDKGQGKSRSIPPVVMILAWIVSVVLTVAIVMVTSDDGGSNVTTPAKAKALEKIEDPQFFGDPARGNLLPYQRLLRQARQARARSDSKAERQYYKQVLDLLHTETWGGATASSSNRLEKGISGSREHDRELEQLILTVLGD
ncbi:MAG: hypothetical protein ACLP9L_01945 [Thermoguttaceae bacterium]